MQANCPQQLCIIKHAELLYSKECQGSSEMWSAVSYVRLQSFSIHPSPYTKDGMLSHKWLGKKISLVTNSFGKLQKYISGIHTGQLYGCSCNLFDIISVYSLKPGKLPGRFSYEWPGYKPNMNPDRYIYIFMCCVVLKIQLFFHLCTGLVTGN